eukprot:TRINITY_DN1404_c0_g1_i1.p1 TRINITY_DN1404_c0_g1~~TRINITY_DN1404_c0_g1_i1.p1  ORF type:complete len:529 (+),score=131.03 TRINITY_DN1404_c0_g1_i1:508-2094(+)
MVGVRGQDEVPREEDTATTISSSDGSTIASIVVRVKLVSPDKLGEYQAIMKEMAEFCHANYKGHLYTGLMDHAKTGQISSVHRFDNMENLQRWLVSEDRTKFLARFGPIVNRETLQVDVVEGATHLFDSPEDLVPQMKAEMRPPPQWKVVTVIVCVLYPMSLGLGFSLVPALQKLGLNSIAVSAVVYAIILPIGIYVLFPLIFGCFRKWLMKPRATYPRHSVLFCLDSGFSVFKPVNVDMVSPVQEAMVNRLSVAEGFIHSLQARVRVLENDGKFNDEELEQMIKPRNAEHARIAEDLRDRLAADAAKQHDENYPVTVKVAVRVPAAYHKSYEKFVRDLGDAASQFEGFVGLDIVRPAQLDAKGNGVYVSITRFQTHTQLIKWLSSRERKELLMQINPFVTLVSGEIEADKAMFQDGFDSFFQKTTSEMDPTKTPAPAPKWKTLVLTYAILFANAQFFSNFVAPLYNKHLPSALTSLITMILNLMLSSYFVTPLMNKICQDWLHTYTVHDIPKSCLGKCLYLGLPGLR